jgi:hypothetical protein
MWFVCTKGESFSFSTGLKGLKLLPLRLRFFANRARGDFFKKSFMSIELMNAAVYAENPGA